MENTVSPRPPRLVFLLNSAQRRLQQWIGLQQAATAGEGVSVPTAAQSGLLFMLDKRDGASMGELAGALKLVPSALSGLVQRMKPSAGCCGAPVPKMPARSACGFKPGGAGICLR